MIRRHAMISDADQRRLDEIERLLRLDDPALARRFDQQPHPPRPVLRTTILATLALLLTLVATSIAAALGGPIAALVAASAMTTTCVGLLLWRRRAQPPTRRS